MGVLDTGICQFWYWFEYISQKTKKSSVNCLFEIGVDYNRMELALYI
jgi:hypothetical protein